MSKKYGPISKKNWFCWHCFCKPPLHPSSLNGSPLGLFRSLKDIIEEVKGSKPIKPAAIDSLCPRISDFPSTSCLYKVFLCSLRSDVSHNWNQGCQDESTKPR